MTRILQIMNESMDIGRRLIALTLSNITVDHEKIDAYEGGPSSLITSICIMRKAFLLVGTSDNRTTQ